MPFMDERCINRAGAAPDLQDQLDGNLGELSISNHAASSHVITCVRGLAACVWPGQPRIWLKRACWFMMRLSGHGYDIAVLTHKDRRGMRAVTRQICMSMV